MRTAEQLPPNAPSELLQHTPADALINRIQHYSSSNFALAMVNATGSRLYEEVDQTFTTMRTAAETQGLSSVREHEDYEIFRRKRDALRELQLLAGDLEQTGSVDIAIGAYRNRQMERRIAETRPLEVSQVEITASQPRIDISRAIDSLRERKPLQNMLAGMRSVAGRIGEKTRDVKDVLLERLNEKKKLIGRLALVGALTLAGTEFIQSYESTDASSVAESGLLDGPAVPVPNILRTPPVTAPVEAQKITEATTTTVAPEAAPVTTVPAVDLGKIAAELQAQNEIRLAEEAAKQAEEAARVAVEKAAAEAARLVRLAPYEAWLSDGRIDPRIANIYRQLILKGHDLVITSTKRDSGGASRHDTGHAIDSVAINGVNLSYSAFSEEVQSFLDDAASLMPENCEIGVPNQTYVNRTKPQAPEGCYVFVDIGTAPHIHLAVDR